MRSLALCCLLLSGLPAQDPAALIEQLKADDIEVREKAIADLERLGAAAEPHLKVALAGAPPIVALQVRRLIRILELNRVFSRRLREAVPDISRRLSVPDTEEWTRLYLELTSRDTSPPWSRADLEPLAAEAVRQARNEGDRIFAMKTAADWNHRSAEPEVLKFIHDEDEDTLRAARDCIRSWHGIGAQKVLVHASERSPFPVHRLDFDEFWGDHTDLIRELRNGRDQDAARMAIYLSTRHGLPGAAEEAPALLKHASPEVRKAAIKWWTSQARPGEGNEILELLGDPDPEVRGEAASAGLKLHLKPEVRQLKDLFQDPEGQATAWSWLIELGAVKELRPHLRARLKGPKDWTLRYPIELLGEVGEAEDAHLLAELRPGLEDDSLAAAMAAMLDLNPVFARTHLIQVVGDAHEKDEQRTTALRILVKRGDLRDLDRLSALTREPSFLVVQAAAELLVENFPGRLDAEVAQRLAGTDSSWTLYCVAPFLVKDGTETSIGAVERALGNPNVSHEAAKALCLLGRARMVPRLRRLLKDPDPHARAVAAQWLGTWRDVESREGLVRALEDDVVEVRMAAARALETFGKGTGVESLQKLAKSEHPNLPGIARKTLRTWGIRESGDELRRCLNESDWRESELLGELIDSGDRDLTWLVEKWLKSGSPYRIREAAELIAGLKLREVRLLLVSLLEHPSAEARGHVVGALAKVGEREDIARLLPLLDEPATAYKACNALIEMKAVEAIPHLLALTERGEVNGQYYAVEILGALKSAEAIPVLRRKLRSGPVTLRCAAAEALGEMRDSGSREAFVAMLRDPWHGVRSSGARALRALASRESVDDLVPLLDDSHEGVREAARRAVCALDPQVARREFLRRLELGRHPDREKLIERIGKLGGTDGVAILIRLLEDDRLQFAAARALANLDAREAGPTLVKLMARAPRSSTRNLVECAARIGIAGPLESSFAGLDPLRRLEAAQFLCSMGDRRGAPAILEFADLGESSMTYWSGSFGCRREDPWGQFLRYTVRPGLSLLNALRKPEAWRKLASTPIEDLNWEPREKSIEKLAGAAGLRLAWDPPPTWKAEEDRSGWTFSLFSRSFREETSDVADSLEECLAAQDSWAYVLEDDHIRMLPRPEAVRFWKQWWADEQARLKK